MHSAKEPASPCKQDPSTDMAAQHQPASKPPRGGRGAKPHVPSACTNCKKAHLACDLQRPCRRCANSGKCDTCKDVQHKKRGRPRSKDKKVPVGSSEKSQMEGQMFQFSFTSPSTTTSSATSCKSVLSPESPLSHAPSPAAATPVSAATTTVSPATNAFSHDALPPSPPHRKCYTVTSCAQASQPSLNTEESAVAAAPASAGPLTTSYLFLTPALLCLRLEELGRANSNSGDALLGHSLLSLINRSVMDFVSEHDKHSVFNAFEVIRKQLASRLAQSPSRVYSHAVLGHPPPAVDPNTFQTLPVDRLLQRVCADVSGNVRAHLRTAAGCYSLFDLHIYVGAVSKPPSLTTAAKGVAALTLDEVYFVCRITKFDALSAAAMSSPLASSAAAFPRFASQHQHQQPMLCGATRKNSLEDDVMASEQHHAKRYRTAEAAASPNALYLLAAATDTSSIGDKQHLSNASSKHSTVSSSPTLMTPSPSLGAFAPPRVGTLPPLSDLLKLLDTAAKPQQQQQQQQKQQSFHSKSYISM
ncbi:hypothetical protein EV175_002624 [Coemansia sp. RSA 1933]|nr:hypothetical protein EV175_002624 [Coemansia sp. RSA 1933]